MGATATERDHEDISELRGRKQVKTGMDGREQVVPCRGSARVATFSESESRDQMMSGLACRLCRSFHTYPFGIWLQLNAGRSHVNVRYPDMPTGPTHHVWDWESGHQILLAWGAESFKEARHEPVILKFIQQTRARPLSTIYIFCRSLVVRRRHPTTG